MGLGYTLLFFTLWTVRIRTAILERGAPGRSCCWPVRHERNTPNTGRPGAFVWPAYDVARCCCIGVAIAENLARLAPGARRTARRAGEAVKRLVYILPVFAFVVLAYVLCLAA